MKVLKNETSMMSESEIYNNQGSRRQQKRRSGKVSKTGEWPRAGSERWGKREEERRLSNKKVKKKRKVRGGEERSRSRRAKRKDERE